MPVKAPLPTALSSRVELLERCSNIDQYRSRLHAVMVIYCTLRSSLSLCWDESLYELFILCLFGHRSDSSLYNRVPPCTPPSPHLHSDLWPIRRLERSNNPAVNSRVEAH